MKTKNSRLLGSIIFPGSIVLVAVILFFSCKKDPIETISGENVMVEAAKALDSKVISGNVTIESNESEIALNYNNGSKYILIEKIEGVEPINVNRIQSAEVITSRYGIILKDLKNNKIFLLTNNDSKSMEVFEGVKSLFDKNLESKTVFGVTVINAEKV